MRNTFLFGQRVVCEETDKVIICESDTKWAYMDSYGPNLNSHLTCRQRWPILNFIAVRWHFRRRNIWTAAVSQIAYILCTSCKEHTSEGIAYTRN